MTSAAVSSAAIAQDPTDIIVTAGGLPGAPSDPDQAPVSSMSITGDALRRDGTTDLLRTINSDLPGVTFDDAQDNPYQPNLLYRGYEASPLGGDAQGIAVYVDGARFNQPFGDTVNWDLIPDVAVRKVTLESANPIFGLNALGGAMAVDLKSGRDFSGVGGETSFGAFGKRAVSGEIGAKQGAWSFYAAGQFEHDDGWRDYSPSTVGQLYADVGVDGGWGSADLKLMGADTDLTGNGASPVELLAARYQSVFTYPDQTSNRYGRALLSAQVPIGEHLTLRPSAYLDHLHQRSLNGDLSDAEPCESDGGVLCLDGDDTARVTDTAGSPFGVFANGSDYGQLNMTETRSTGYGAALQLDGTVGANRFAIGGSWDGSDTRFDALSILGLLSTDRGFVDPQGVIDMADGPIRPVDVTSLRNDFGLYVSDTIAITPAIDVTAAARYNNSRVTLEDQLGTSLNGAHSYARLNPAIGGSWRVGGGTSLYGGYAESNRAPTPAELSCADPAAPCSLSAFFVGDPNLRQVVSRSWEAGVRGDLTRGTLTVSWRLDGWRTTNSDDIIFAASDTVGRAYFRNVGETRRQGIEAWMSAAKGPWSGTISYVLTDATYRTAFMLASPDNPDADANGMISVQPGDRLPGIPRHLGKLTIARRFGDAAQLSATGQCSSGRWLLGDEANLTQPTASYCIANVAGQVRVIRGVTLFVEVRNVFNREYATFGTFSETDQVTMTEAPGATDPRSLSPGAPRTWWLGIRIRQ